MTKKKTSSLKNWDSVNFTLKILGEKKIELEKLEGEQTIKINEIKRDFELKGRAIKTIIKNMEDDIELFCEDNKAEFVKDRTKKFTFGKVSYRLTESLFIKNVASTVAALKSLNLKQYLRIKEEPDKEALAGLDDDKLIKVGVMRKKLDKINIEPNYDELVSQP